MGKLWLTTPSEKEREIAHLYVSKHSDSTITFIKPIKTKYKLSCLNILQIAVYKK